MIIYLIIYLLYLLFKFYYTFITKFITKKKNYFYFYLASLFFSLPTHLFSSPVHRRFSPTPANPGVEQLISLGLTLAGVFPTQETPRNAATHPAHRAFSAPFAVAVPSQLLPQLHRSLEWAPWPGNQQICSWKKRSTSRNPFHTEVFFVRHRGATAKPPNACAASFELTLSWTQLKNELRYYLRIKSCTIAKLVKNPFQLEIFSSLSEDTTGKLSTWATRRNLRKSIPTTVALGMCFRRI